MGLLLPQPAAASFDPTQPCTLTLTFSRNEEVFPDLVIDIYRVAELCDDGSYELIAPFSDYPINIYGISSQQEWKDIAQTVRSYVLANHIAPYQTRTTDGGGFVRFTDLETGLYMVKGVTLTTESYSENHDFSFSDFMIYLPTPTENGYDYNVEAKPKSVEHALSSVFTVTKLWNDSGESNQRPDAVTINILRNGEVQQTITLDRSNNWTYTWEDPDGTGSWSVMETDVAKDYKVSIVGNEATFTITNTKTTTSTIPETGDTAPVLLYVVVLCVSGFGLMMLGILWMRDRNNDKKR